MDNLIFGKNLEIWVGKVGNFEKKLEIWGKIETWKNCKFGKMWKSGKIWKKFGNFENIQIFGNYLEIWIIENLEKEIWK